MELNESVLRKILREQVSASKKIKNLEHTLTLATGDIASLKEMYHRQGMLAEESDARIRQILEIVSLLASKVSAIEIRLETFDEHKERLSAVETAVRTHIADKKIHRTNP